MTVPSKPSSHIRSGSSSGSGPSPSPSGTSNGPGTAGGITGTGTTGTSSLSTLLAANAPATPKIPSPLNPSASPPSSASNTPTLLHRQLPPDSSSSSVNSPSYSSPSSASSPDATTQPQAFQPKQPFFFARPRGHSTSTMRATPLSSALSSDSTSTLVSPLSRVTSEPHVPLPSSSQSPLPTTPTTTTTPTFSPYSVFGITLSPPRLGNSSGLAVERSNSATGTMTPPNGSPSSWWGGSRTDGDSPRLDRRPWTDAHHPKRKKTVPEEQTEGWVNTRQRVAQAAASVLGTTGDVVHEVLLTGVGLLEFAPVPGLAAAAHVLLNIWDALQLVDTNRLQCLRLTERCAEILMSVRQEVKEAGDMVGDELATPITKLIESFTSVHAFLLKQVHRPFLKRYLKRDEILGQIKGCDAGLSEALGMFGISIQIRILKQVQESERRRLEDRRVLFGALGLPEGGGEKGEGLPGSNETGGGNKHALLPPYTPRVTTTTTTIAGRDEPSSSTTPMSMPEPTLVPPASASAPPPLPSSILASPSSLRASQILPTLKTIHATQDTFDAARDNADLRALMKAALQTSSDVEMLGVLQIGREEMPDAIKTLQRALERVGEGEEEGVVGGGDPGGGGVEGGGNVVAIGEEGKGKEEGEKDKKRKQDVISRMKLVRNRASTNASGSGSGSSLSSGKSNAAGPSTSSNQPNPDNALTGTTQDTWGRDTLDREFIESGIDALRRMSRTHGLSPTTMTLPSWTITRYEVDREAKIGIGFFSDVYRGTWRGRTVAIKVLAPTTPRALFLREVEVWKGMGRHEGVLELYGASSASGERPWFFVSPYMRRGSLVEFLKRVVAGEEGVGVVGGYNGVGVGGAGEGVGRQVVGRARTATFPVWESGMEAGGRARERRESQGHTTQQGVVKLARERDLFRFMLEVAKGMEHLHSNGVLHGDLKAANVLVADDLCCVISDFGQSEMKSEVYRISGAVMPHGTLRWQAPELMSGRSQLALTPQMDVYAYAISCVEIVSWGKLPWPLMDDEAVRRFVIQENLRPPLPLTRYNTPLLQELLRVCWHQDPDVRPSFEKIADDVRAIRKAFLRDGGGSAYGDVGVVGGQLNSPLPMEVERDRQWEWGVDHTRTKPSPDMRPGPLPVIGTPPREGAAGMLMQSPSSPDSTATNSTFVTAHEDDPGTPLPRSTLPNPLPPASGAAGSVPHHSHLEDTVSTSRVQMPEPVLYTPSEPSTRESSLFSHTPSSRSLEDLEISAAVFPPVADDANGGGAGASASAGGGGGPFEGYESPAPLDDRIRMMRDERRYRLLLGHQFHPSLTLPLWSPSPVYLGAVGYLSKPQGKFVTLFNSFHPEKSAEGPARELPSLHGYGRVNCGSQRQDKRNAAQRGYDAFVGLLTFRGRTGPVSQNVSRRYSFPLRAGHKIACMCTETTMYRYMERLEVPKKWFKANVDAILQIYGATHHIQKEDLFLVIGTLDTPDYALFVSHSHPDGQAHFNVFSPPRSGRPWGTFTTDTEVPPELGGPFYNEPVPDNPLSSSKVSNNGGPWDTVLVARLRFKPDILEPTSV